ncbi:hypothetical protein [Desulfosarcina cetonica]|uniref:hypothetical protein n=1 Tax=Desulfosarcina cetonica TaxID=90730 RepID=UPI0006D23556|nr:hypothetical protein [Desulfosarcina cetonica]
MIGVFVRFCYADDFDANAVQAVADNAHARFKGMPQLRFKAFTINPEKREAVNFYIWESMEAARAFFNEALLERVTGHYKVRPILEFVEIAAIVDNAAQ